MTTQDSNLNPGQDTAHSSVDPIALSIFASRTMAIGEEMGAHLGRTALSANIRDRRDYSCAVFDANGELIAQATHIPVHLGSMAYAMSDLAQNRDWQPGDVLILNDPYRGGTHLPDVTLIVPVWVRLTDSAAASEDARPAPEQGEGSVTVDSASGRQRLLGFTACRAHYADIGAGETGSMGIARSLDEEGVLLAPSLLYRAGEYQSAVVEPLLQRVRDRALVHGDIRAQLSTCEVGAKRLQALFDLLGAASWSVQVQALQDYAQRLATAAIAAVPAGRYCFTDYLDDDGHDQRDIAIQVAIEVKDGRMAVDFSGSAERVPGNLNCPLSVTAAAVYYVVRCLLPAHTPVCAGAMRPVTFHAPRGSLLNAQAPAAVALGNVETSSRIVDVLLGALAQALPDRIPAASQGTMNNLAMAGRAATEMGRGTDIGDTAAHGGWSYYETLAGGCGASAQGPGACAQHSHMTNTLNTPVEVLERHYPMRIVRYAVRHGSGGNGRHRGGDGLIRDYEFLAPARVALLSERRRHGPWGLAGGDAGQVGCNRLDGEVLPGKAEFDVQPGQVLSVATPGGGGFGGS